MNPVLLLPAGLAALAALAVPLLLHLARREDRRPVDFAALRWLSTRVRPRRSLRVEEPLLLALRLLLVVLLALLLARPALEDGGTGTPWIVAAPGVGLQALATADSGSAGAVERRWLAPGFPPMGDAPGAERAGARTASGNGLASLLRELDMRMPSGAPLVVLVPPVLDGMDAERPRLSRPVDWRVVDGPAADGAQEPPVVVAPAPPRLVFLQEDGPRFLRAVADAWATQRADEASAAGTEVRVWSDDRALPETERAWVEAGGTVLLPHGASSPDPDAEPGVHADVDASPEAGTGPGTGEPLGATVLWRDAEGRPLLRASPLGHGRLLQWARPLDPDVFPDLLEADFPDRLRDALQPPPLPARVLAREHAPDVADVGPWPAAVRDARPWLALILAILFVLERWIAAGPRAGGRT